MSVWLSECQESKGWLCLYCAALFARILLFGFFILALLLFPFSFSPCICIYSSLRNVVAAMLRPTRAFKDATIRLTNALPMEAFRTRLVPITKRLPMIARRLPWPILVLHRVVVPSSLSIFDTTSFSTGSTRALLLLIPSLERYVLHVICFSSVRVWYSAVIVSTWAHLLVSYCCPTQVTEGFDIVEKISKVPTHNESPKEPIEMLSIRIS